MKIGAILQISAPPEPLNLYDSKDALAADGLYYVSWTAGEGASYTNEDGDPVSLYPAQATLLASEKKDTPSAQAELAGWQSASTDNYEITATQTKTVSGQKYTYITYTMKNPDSPWQGGVSAFAVHNNVAVCAELTYQEFFEEDPDRILTDLLTCFTYTD